MAASSTIAAMIGDAATPLRDRAARACERWAERGIRPELARFVDYVTERLARVPEPMRDRLHVDDLYLAFACGRLDRDALELFEREVMPHAARVLRRMNIANGIADDVLGGLREKLFVSSAGAPLIHDYSGRGRLVAWLRSLAANAALKALRGRARMVELDHADDIPITDVELVRLRTGDAVAFRAALREAFAALERDQRTLMRQHYLDGLTFEALARLHGVHVSTAWRRLEVARDVLVRGVRARLAQTLQASESTVTRIVRAAYADASVTSVLRETPLPRAGV